MKNNRIWPRRRTAMLLLAALFSVRCFSYPVSGDMKTARERTVFVEDDEGGPEEVWLENDLGFSDDAIRRRFGRGGSRATESSLGKGGASPSSLAEQRATASVLRGQAASSSNLGMPAFLAGFLPASPSALLKSAGERKVNVHVTKTWGDGADAHAGEEVTVHLLADGADTGRTAVLNRDGGWEADFKGLPASGEHGVIDYRVSEDVPSGYVPFYSYSGGADGHEYWIPAETIEEGGTYVLAADGIAPTAEGGDGGMVMRTLDRQTRARRIEGKVCHDYITDPDEDAMWVFSEGTRGWEMTSPESGRMLAFDRVNSTYAFTTRENPVSARRAFFPADPEES
ncbi:MAG: Cna B-type domain-containing protein, partial [Clostridium sp.]|nr:Cna B-type domain-containing protein [Clostridium sp.]